MRSSVELDWGSVGEILEKVDELRSVLDIDRRIADWWRELPYPLAAVYRRYQVSISSKDKLEALLHFFELNAVYLAVLGISVVAALRPGWKELLGKWMHPPNSSGIARADFGFWVGLARASLKDCSRIASDAEARRAAEERDPELIQYAALVGTAGAATKVLDIGRAVRNSTKGHGGHLKESDAARHVAELAVQVRELFELTATLHRRILLVRPGGLEVTDNGFLYSTAILASSDPAFSIETTALGRAVKSHSLGFWPRGSRTICPAIPFFRLGVPQEPKETSMYVFNRVDDGGFRWVSYQEAREQDFVAPDEYIADLIALKSGQELE